MGHSVVARFVKLRGKTSVVEFSFIKVVGQKSDAVINMELFLKFSPPKLSPMKNFHDEKLYLSNTFFQVEIKVE